MDLNYLEQIKKDAERLTKRRLAEAQEDGSFTPTETPQFEGVTSTGNEGGTQNLGAPDEVERLKAELAAKDEELAAKAKEVKTLKAAQTRQANKEAKAEMGTATELAEAQETTGQDTGQTAKEEGDK